MNKLFFKKPYHFCTLAVILFLFVYGKHTQASGVFEPPAKNAAEILDRLDQYDNKILIGGELEKQPDALFENLTFETAFTTINEVIDIPKMIELIKLRPYLTFETKFKGDNFIRSLNSNHLLKMWTSKTTEKSHNQILSLIFSAFRSTKSEDTFSDSIMRPTSPYQDLVEALNQVQFGRDHHAIEFRHKKPYSAVRDFYRNIITINRLFGLNDGEIDHVHITIKPKQITSFAQLLSQPQGSLTMDLEPILIELNKLRYLQAIDSDYSLNGKISPQLTKPDSLVTFKNSVRARGLYRLIDQFPSQRKDRIEIRSLKRGILEELEFHLRYLTMNQDLAVAELRKMQNEILQNRDVTKLIMEFRSDTADVFMNSEQRQYFKEDSRSAEKSQTKTSLQCEQSLNSI